MNKLSKLLVLALFVCIFTTTANAQYVTGANPQLSYKAMGKIVNDKGEKLSSEEISKLFTPNLYTDYTDAKRKHKTGMILSGIGAAALLYGTTNIVVGEIRANKPTDDGSGLGQMIGGWFFITPGIVLSAIGVPKLIKGKKALVGVTEEYNQSRHKTTTATLSLGATKNGIGLALNF